MDPATIAAGLVAVLAPLLASAGSAAADVLVAAVGRKAAERLTDVWRRLRPGVAADPDAKDAVAQLARRPDDEEARRKLAARIAEILATDARLARDTDRAVTRILSVVGDRNVVQSGHTNLNVGTAGDITITNT